MFNVLDRYIGKIILMAIFITLFTLTGLSAIIKFVEQFRAIGNGSYDIWKAISYTLLTMPKDIETFFPMAALLGALMGLGTLASSSELVVMQASGLSRFKIGLSVMKTAIPLVIITMLIGEWGVPQTEQFARNMRSQALNGGSLLSVKNGIWAKEGNDFVFIQQVNEDNQLKNIQIYQFNNNKKLEKIKQANQATFDGQAWVFNQLSEATIGEEKIETQHYLNYKWQTNLTPDKLGIAALKPTSLSISGLSDYIQFLKQTGQESRRFELTFWRKLLQPLSISVMMLLALSFIFGPLRSVTTGARVVAGILSGFVFYVINEIFGPLSLVYNVPPLLGALLPSLLFFIATWWLLAKKSG